MKIRILAGVFVAGILTKVVLDWSVYQWLLYTYNKNGEQRLEGNGPSTKDVMDDLYRELIRDSS